MHGWATRLRSQHCLDEWMRKAKRAAVQRNAASRCVVSGLTASPSDKIANPRTWRAAHTEQPRHAVAGMVPARLQDPRVHVLARGVVGLDAQLCAAERAWRNDEMRRAASAARRWAAPRS